MDLANKQILNRFVKKHAIVLKAVERWVSEVENAQWSHHADLKNDFPGADYVGNNRYVFNLKGDGYRIVTIVLFIDGVMNVRWIGTHGEYDKIDCSTI